MEVVSFSSRKRDVSLVPLRELQKPDDVPICVFDRGNQPPPTDICDLLLRVCASVYQCLQALVNVAHVEVTDRSRHAWLWP